MKLSWTQFSGIRPRVDPRLLPDGSAQVAQNVYLERGGLRGILGLLDIAPLAKVGVKTIYRFGQALASATQYWFTWTDDVDVVKGPIADDTEERTYWTGGGAPRYTTAAIGTTGTDLPSASRPLGVPAPAMAPVLAASGAPPADAGMETRVYIYTFVTDMGEESAPSGPTTVEIVVGQGVSVSGMDTAASNGAVLTHKRIYRAQRGPYLFVAEIPIATTQYTDTLASADLGEVCPSVGWDMPSPSMTGLTGGPNGMMAAIDGYTVRFCEPFRPFAWPEAYSQTVDYPCVGLGQFGQAFVVLTTGLPYVMTGVDPAGITTTPAKFYQPCVSKRSIVSTGGDVIWASPDGLVSIGASDTQVLTQGLFTPTQWRALHPETIIGAWHEGRYVGSYDPGTGRVGFMLRPSTQEWIDLPQMAATAMYRDTVGDALYLCVGDRIMQFRAGSVLPFTWMSQEAVTPLMTFSAARVTGDYPITFTLYKDGAAVHTRAVTSDEPFRLPDGIGRSWEILLTGSSAVLGAAIAESVEEL